MLKKTDEIIFINKNIGMHKTARPHLQNWVFDTGFHYDTLS